MSISQPEPLTSEHAIENIYRFIADLYDEWSWNQSFYPYDSEEDMFYIWSEYAAECLIAMIEAYPDKDPLSIAKDFLSRLESYIVQGSDSETMFWSYAQAIESIIDYYFE